MRLYSLSLKNVLLGATTAVLAAAPLATAHAESVRLGSVATKAPVTAATTTDPSSPVAAKTKAALDAIAGNVRQLSHPQALENAFRGYFAYQAAHPEKVKKPYLYFVDYGLSSSQARGYVFDMSALKIVDGPFTVAHGRGSAANGEGIPTRFNNASGSAATSLGLYVAQELYDFTGHSGGRTYSAVGLRLNGVSGNYNSNARSRGVVAHGAPYVTSNRAGRSEGCPAMELGRAERLLPKLANGGMVFLFAPNANWMAGDPWVTAG